MKTQSQAHVKPWLRPLLSLTSAYCRRDLQPFAVHRLSPAKHSSRCPGFRWDRVNFLPSSWYSAMFWIQYEKNVDNTLMFSVVAK